MRKALLAWELGGGQGHIQRLVAIAHLLTIEGIEPILAFRDLNVKHLNLPWKLLQAPTPVLKPLDSSGATKSYLFTDILDICGFGDPITLSFQLQAWQNLINLVRPNFIIADFAPTGVLAASGQIPTLVIGTEFTIPPPSNDFPPIRYPVPTASRHRQSQIQQTIQQVIGKDTPLGQLLNGDRTLIFSLPQLDPYREVRHQPEYVGIHNAPLPTNLGKKNGSLWGYLDADWRYTPLVKETLQPNCEFGAWEKIWPLTSAAIHHGGSTTSIACLLAGIPQILLPKHQEQVLRAKVLESIGVALSLPLPTTTTLNKAQIQLPDLFNKARAWATENQQWNHNYLLPSLLSWLTNV